MIILDAASCLVMSIDIAEKGHINWAYEKDLSEMAETKTNAVSSSMEDVKGQFKRG